MNFDMYDEQAKALRERVAAADKAAAAESAQGVKTDASGGGGNSRMDAILKGGSVRKKAKKTKGKRESVSEEEIDAIVRDETLSVLDRVKKLRKLNVPYIHIGKKFGEPNGWVQYLLKGSVRKKANKTKPSSQASEPAHRKRGRPRKSETLTVKQAAENSAERLKVSVHSITNNGGYAEIVLHVPIAQARSFYVGECELKVVTP